MPNEELKMERENQTLVDALHDHFIDNMPDKDLNFGEDNSGIASAFADMAEEFVLARERALLEEAGGALRLILPLARGYVANNQVGANEVYVRIAEDLLSLIEKR